MKYIHLTNDLCFALDNGAATIFKSEAEYESASESTAWVNCTKLGRKFWKQNPLELGGIVLIDALSAVKGRLAGAIIENDQSTETRALIAGAGAACGCAGWRKSDDYAVWEELLEQRINVVVRTQNKLSALGRMGRAGAKYSVILADPPWDYDDNGSRLSAQFQDHYQYMPLRDICNLGPLVREAAAKDAILLLCVTNTALIESRHLPVCEAWGFEPKTLVPWIKTNREGTGVAIGGGHYSRAVSEEFHLAAKGGIDIWAEEKRIVISAKGRASSSVVKDRSVPGIIVAPRVPATDKRSMHSAKPSALYDFAEQLFYPPYLELFARSNRPGWDTWGAQAPAENE